MAVDYSPIQQSLVGFSPEAQLNRSGERLRQLYMGQQMEQAKAQEARAQEQLGLQKQQVQLQRDQFDSQQVDAEAKRMITLFSDVYGPMARAAKESGNVRAYWTTALQNPAIRARVEQDGVFDLATFDPNDPDLESENDILAGFAEPDKNGTKIGAFNPGDYTPASFAKFQKTGKVEDLVRYQAPQRVSVPSGYQLNDDGSLTPRAGGPADTKNAKNQFTMSDKLRDEYNAASKDLTTIADNYAAIQSVAKDNSAAGDLSLIFSYMKMLDPGSVVREAEFANAQNAAGVPERIRNQWNRALNGERLAPAQRADFLNQAGNLFESRKKRHDVTVKKRYVDMADRYGINPDDVISDLSMGQGAASGGVGTVPAGGPAVGTVEGGYRFKGGDPANPSSWEQVR